MRIAVVGIGGVGAYIGAKLCALKDEHEIIFVARGDHLKAIQDKGLKIINIDKEETYFPSSAQEKVSGPIDILFLCTKTYHSQEAISKLGSAVTKETLLIPIANGVNSHELLSPVTSARLTQACVYIVSHQISPGIIKKSTDTFALILSEDVQEILEPIMEKAGLRVKFTSDIRKELWKKYLFISAMGCMTSYYGQGMGLVYKEHYDELVSLFKEVFSVAQAEGVALEEKEIDKSLSTAAKLPSDAPTSLWLDIQAHKQNELESLCYYLILSAQKHGLCLPIMQKIYAKLQ